MSDIVIEIKKGFVVAVYTPNGGKDVTVIDHDNLKAGGTVDLYSSIPMVQNKEYETMIKDLREYGIKPEDLL
jgi:hypothetical protein